MLVVVGPFVSHVELAWTLPQFKAFAEQLATFCRVALFDKAGVGLSDRVPKVRTLDDQAAEVEAVMDAAGFGQAVVSGLSDGGPVAMMFAATRPERTRALTCAAHTRFTQAGGMLSTATPPSCGRATFPSWVKTTRRLLSSSPAGWKPRAPCDPGGAAVPQPASARRRSGRYASWECWSA